MSLFMDCSEAGYSNMDMDLVKFIISLFRQFYPLKLGSIYVYEMPWVMNAGWSIIKSWLSPAARNKMRFLQKDSIGQFFSRDQLIARYTPIYTCAVLHSQSDCRLISILITLLSWNSHLLFYIEL